MANQEQGSRKTREIESSWCEEELPGPVNFPKVYPATFQDVMKGSEHPIIADIQEESPLLLARMPLQRSSLVQKIR
jgi:hypothetical protein